MRSLQHIFRRLGRAPMFTSVALVTLALGIGANTAIFSVVNGVLIKPLAYPQSEQLVGVWHLAPGVNIPGNMNCSPAMYFTRSIKSAFKPGISLGSCQKRCPCATSTRMFFFPLFDCAWAISMWANEIKLRATAAKNLKCFFMVWGYG